MKNRYDKSKATVTKGRKDALKAVRCPTRGCEGFAQPQKGTDGQVRYTCPNCTNSFILRKM